jgi:hypothetical protein
MCPKCGREQHTRPVTVPPQLRGVAGGDTRYFWDDCPCETERRELLDLANAARVQAHADALTDAAMNYDGLRHRQQFQLRAFNPARLRSTGGIHPYVIATRWAAHIVDLDHSDLETGPPPALWFYCPGPGRGKTHLATGIALDVKHAGRSACFLDGRTWLDRLWSATFAQRESMRAFPGERAHLTVVDDFCHTDGASGGARDEWDKLIDRRYISRRWTIFTAQATPDELLDRGAITDAAHSRIQHLTRGATLYFDGDDQRRVRPS